MPTKRAPYKAAESFGPADGELFFGRDSEGTALARFVADRPISVLTAPSGFGKSSLLLAKVLPLLEREHWCVVYARPQGDVCESIQTALIENLLPDPRCEADAMDRLAALMPAQPVPTLESGREWFRALPDDERLGHRLCAPPADTEFTPLPMFCRGLRGSLRVIDLIEHFEAMVADGPALGLSPDTPLAALARLLRGTATVSLWEGWKRRFADNDRVGEAIEAFRGEWMPLRPTLTGLLLVLDQFEEMFSLQRPEDVAHFMASIGRMLARESSCALHVALSLRKEFFADLVPHLRPFGSLERMYFFLGPMQLDQARNALAGPAALVGLTFAGQDRGDFACVDRILMLALHEPDAPVSNAAGIGGDTTIQLAAANYYAPALISLVGAHLWQRLKAEPSTQLPLSVHDFERLVPKVEDVFESFLEEALNRIPGNPTLRGATPFDALELLDRLVTPTGFRNIIAESELVKQLPLDPAAAGALLDFMDRGLKLIRRESRRGGRFVEIMHERLIEPIRRMLADLRRRDVVRASLTPALDMLGALPDDFDPTRDPLPPHFRETLVEHLERIKLDRLAAKHLLRSLLIAGPGSDSAAAPDAALKRRWSAAVARLTDAMRPTSRDAPERTPLLARAELDAAIAALEKARGSSVRESMVRHIAMSALADRSEQSGARIRRTFASIASAQGGIRDH